MKLGQYEIHGRIAIGGMAEIYRGRAIGEEGFEKPVAIKRILPHYAADARFVTMLLTEARIHASLSHQNIVQIHDLGISEEGEYFIVLEYVDGRDLAALLGTLHAKPGARPSRLPDAVSLYVMIELGQGVHFAHEMRGPDGQPLGLVHRDISPSNVLVSYAGEVKLFDFGLAKRRTDHSVVGSVKGKLAYMSPEQARRVPVDRRTDIFSLGAVLFEMLTGRRLREISDDANGWSQVASGLVPSHRAFRSELHPALAQLLARSLAPDPADRFPDANAFVTAARGALDTVHRSAAGEASELQSLLANLLPPGSPRRVTAPSRVIRLVSEFLPAERTVRAPVPSPARHRGAAPRPGAPGLTEPGGAARRRTPPSLPLAALAGGGGGVSEPRPARLAPAPAAAVARAHLPRTSPPQPLFAPSNLAAAPPALPRPLPFAGRLPRKDRPSGSAGRVLLAATLTIAAVAAAVHFTLIPLPVLLVWGTPARLEVSTQPSGAEVLLDGRRLSTPTPTQAEVIRDRISHVVELRKAGFQPVRRIVRFDRNEVLSVSEALPPENRPSFHPMPHRDGRGARAARPPGVAPPR